MTPRVWTCQKQQGGRVCKHVNPLRKRKCGKCGKPRLPTKRPAHMRALELSYEGFIELNGGEHCAICKATRPPNGRRLQRDHSHATGEGRGLLCFRCNRFLQEWMTPDWLRSAVAYLERDVQAPGVRAVTPIGEAA